MRTADAAATSVASISTPSAANANANTKRTDERGEKPIVSFSTPRHFYFEWLIFLVLEIGARCGHVSVVEWAINAGATLGPLSFCCCTEAAMNGHLSYFNTQERLAFHGTKCFAT